MPLSEALQKKLMNHIKFIPSMIGMRLETEKSINPAYTDIEHASLCPLQARIWALRADETLTLALGIKNRWTELGNTALIQQIDASMHAYIDVNDPYGHPSLAIPENGYNGNVYYAGWLYRDHTKAHLLLYTGRYQNRAATSLQKKILEQYIAHQLIMALDVEEVIFIEPQKEHDIQYFLQNESARLKNRTQRTYTMTNILQTLEEHLNAHVKFIWWNALRSVSEQGNVSALIQLIEDKTSPFYDFSPYERQFNAWSVAQRSTQLESVLVEQNIHIIDLEALSAQQCLNLVFGPTRAFKEVQAVFYTQGLHLGLIDCSTLLDQVKTASRTINNILNILSEKEWLSAEIILLLLSTPSHNSHKVKSVIESLSFEPFSPEFGQACVKAILNSMKQHEDPQHMIYAIKKLQEFGLLKSMAHTEHFLNCLADHPNIRYIAFWSDRFLGKLRFDITDATPGMSFAPSIDEWRAYLKTAPNKIDIKNSAWDDSDDLQVLSQRTRFDMACHGKNAIGITTLCQALNRNKTVKELCLFQVSLQHSHLQAIAELLANNKFITELRLGYCDINDDGVAILAEGLRRNTSVTDVDLCGNPIRDQGAEILSEVIQETHHIKRLRLDGCKIGDQGIKKLASICENNLPPSSPFFKHSPSGALDALLIDDNVFGSIGLQALVTPRLSLKELRLSDLRVSDHHFDTHTMRTCFAYLRGNKSLVTLDLSGRKIAAFGTDDANELIESLLSLLAKHKTLKHLRLDDFCILHQGNAVPLENYREEIQQALYKNPNKIQVYGISGMACDIAEQNAHSKPIQKKA